ncbi:MAG: DNA translocase FtsK 4TM domain-containing protein [Phycisphaerae bacterium]
MATRRMKKTRTDEIPTLKPSSKKGKWAAPNESDGDAPPGPTQSPYWTYCFVALLTGVVILSWLSLLTYSPADPPGTVVYPPADPVNNAAGIVGAHLAHTLRYWLGGGAYMALLFATIAATIMMLGGKVTDVAWRLAGVTVLVVTTAAAIYLASDPSWRSGIAGNCGVIGASAGFFLESRFGDIGGWVVICVMLAIGLLLTADDWVLEIPRQGRKVWARCADHMQRRQQLPDDLNVAARARQAADVAKATKPAPPVKTPTTANMPDDDRKKQGILPGFLKGKKDKGNKGGRKSSKKTVKVSPAAESAKPTDAEADRYALPSETLLAEPTGGYIEEQEAHASQRAGILQQTLDNFGVAAQVVGHMTGPVITMFELSLEPGVKVSQISNLANDIARALSVSGVRVVSPIPGKDTVGIEVPNQEKEIVRIKELMKLAPEAEKKLHLPLFLGKDVAGEPIVTDLGAAPHMLIAGTTGSGKSVCINAIIMSLLMTRRPEDVRFILADPKMVEMAAFENIPHLLCPIVTDMRKAEDILEWACVKMDERYALLREAGVRNIAGYNRLSKKELYERFEPSDEEEKKRIPLRLPYWVIIIDELADLMMISSKEVEGYIIRIAQKARAVGIHMVLATQRPSADVVTGLIKSNVPSRASFRVASRQESRIVLDQNGAEVLMGQGDMLFLAPGSSTLSRSQGTFVDDREIHKVVKELRKHGEPKYNNELVKLHSRPPGDISDERDEMFDKAVEVVLQAQRGSVSLLQRRLQVGYGRASRIIDQMSEAGLIGEHKGSQARECLITMEDWESMKANIAADQSGENSLNGEPTSA